MKMKVTAVATVVGTALCLAAASASATNLGEVWVGDQQDGKLYIFDQADLNDASVDAVETTIDLTSVPNGVNSTRMHIIGFSNHKGKDPNSRAILAYLNGRAEVWKTNGGTKSPELVTALDVSNTNTGAAVDSLHMCGGNPQNTLYGCSSIGNKELVLFSMDIPNDQYLRIGGFPLSGLTIHPSVKGRTLGAIKHAIAKGILNGAPICNNFDTSGKLLYATTNNGGVGGVLVLDVSDPSNPRLRDAFNGTGVGCGLVNSQDGRFMWTNAGSKSPTDDERAFKWKFRDAYNNRRAGPRREVDLPEKPVQTDGDFFGGDVHGAQFAGLGGLFLWELMRLDDVIHVIEPRRARLVNTIDLEGPQGTGLQNPAGDVLDRSALGTAMYFSTRGAVPTTAITGINDVTRRPGVAIYRTLFGFSGRFSKIEDIQSGNIVFLCVDPNNLALDDDDVELCPLDGDGNPLPETGEDYFAVDSADPHGLKSLSFISGGF